MSNSLIITAAAQPGGTMNIMLKKVNPLVEQPVHVKLPVKVYYDDGKRRVPIISPLLCSKALATIVLQVISDWCVKYTFALVEEGTYVQRNARHADGTPIMPIRWSNHALGNAIDMKGVITDNGNGQYLLLTDMKTTAPNKYTELMNGIAHAIAAAGRKEEIMPEATWIHFGMWPAKG